MSGVVRLGSLGSPAPFGGGEPGGRLCWAFLSLSGAREVSMVFGVDGAKEGGAAGATFREPEAVSMVVPMEKSKAGYIYSGLEGVAWCMMDSVRVRSEGIDSDRWKFRHAKTGKRTTPRGSSPQPDGLAGGSRSVSDVNWRLGAISGVGKMIE